MEVSMTAKILTATLGTVLLLAPLTFAQDKQDKKPSPTTAKTSKSTGSADREAGMSQDMRDAIAWERHKDAAAARQARIEAKHPSVTYNNANRTAEDTGSTAKDPGPKKDK
jgi:hypothetical protein